jgi:hypothetical protein
MSRVSPSITDRHWADIQNFCKGFEKERSNDFERYLTEAWFSNTLAWLLNPKESHGLGVKFSNAFLAAIAKERTKGCSTWSGNDNYTYAHRNTMLKWRRSTHKGQSPRGLSLKNAFPIREFYLSRDPRLKRPKGLPAFIDILFIDMDLHDGLVVTVENKLFTTNHSGQLEYYYSSIEKKFSAATVREYVYLTLLGDAPVAQNPRKLNQWVCVSWIDDIRVILQKLVPGVEPNPDLLKLLHILNWLKTCHPTAAPLEGVPVFRKKLLENSTLCLLEELNRLGGEKRGRWDIKKCHQKIGNTLIHSSYPTRQLHVNLLPNLTITITGKDAVGGLFEKVIVPFGCNAAQMFNLLDIASRDIYRLFFRKPALYLDTKRRRRVLSVEKTAHQAFFTFVCEYATALRLLFTFYSLKRGSGAASKKKV